MQGVRVQSLFGELRSHRPWGMAKNNKESRQNCPKWWCALGCGCRRLRLGWTRDEGPKRRALGGAAAVPVATTSLGHRTPSWGRGSLTEEQKGWATERWSLVPHLTWGLSQICHGGSLPALAATSSHRPPSPAWLNVPPSPWQVCLCLHL